MPMRVRGGVGHARRLEVRPCAGSRLRWWWSWLRVWLSGTPGSACPRGCRRTQGLRGISTPVGITVGPDGALWFTNAGNDTIGRLDTDGMLDRFTAAGVERPWGITAGPDKAVWFTNRGSDSIGRISADGRDPDLPRRGDRGSGRDHGRPGWGALVHELRQRHDRPDHDRRRRHELRRQGDPAADRDHAGARRGALVREQRQQLDRPDHAPTASCTALPQHGQDQPSA